MGNMPKVGQNTIIGKDVALGSNVVIQNNCIIEDHVTLGDNVYIDNNCLIRNDATIGDNSTVGANCILGEYQMDFFQDHGYHKHVLTIGRNAIISKRLYFVQRDKHWRKFSGGSSSYNSGKCRYWKQCQCRDIYRYSRALQNRKLRKDA